MMTRTKAEVGTHEFFSSTGLSVLHASLVSLWTALDMAGVANSLSVVVWCTMRARQVKRTYSADPRFPRHR